MESRRDNRGDMGKIAVAWTALDMRANRVAVTRTVVE